MQEQEYQPETLASVPNELEAAMIVSALAAEGIDATFAGSFTAGFRAEAPGDVDVLVRQRDLPRAKSVLEELNPQLATQKAVTTPAETVRIAQRMTAWQVFGFVALLAGAILYACF